MKNKNIPFTIINYITKEFIFCLLIVFLVFLSLSLLINFVEEMSFFKEKKIDNLISFVIFLSLIKTPNTLIELSIFIFLFSGILFFVKIQKNNEINTILLSGISKILPVLAPAIFSFFFGLFIIFTLTPISSSLIKIYENNKRIYSSNENLIVMNNLGLWFIENLSSGYNIIRADTVANNNFSKLNNVTIYNLDKNFNFIKRIDSQSISIKEKNWSLENSKILYNETDSNNQKSNKFNLINLSSSIEIEDLKNYFSNVNTVSFWDISSNIDNLNLRGYSADELKIKFHKYLSLPIYLFGIIILATIFTISLNKEYNTLMYLFFGLISGFLLYFLNDLSIAVGVSNKLPLILSVWSPVILIILLSILNIIKINEK